MRRHLPLLVVLLLVIASASIYFVSQNKKLALFKDQSLPALSAAVSSSNVNSRALNNSHRRKPIKSTLPMDGRKKYIPPKPLPVPPNFPPLPKKTSLTQSSSSPSLAASAGAALLALNAPPMNLTATPSTTQNGAINLNWTDNSSEEDFFIAIISEEGSPWVDGGTFSANTTSFTSRGLVAGKAYSYAINAYDIETDSYSGWSSAVTARPSTSDSLPQVPSNVTVTLPKPNNFGTVVWTINSNNAYGFKVERATSQSGPYTVLDTLRQPVGTLAQNSNGPGTLTGYTDQLLAVASLIPGTTYYYRISAYNFVGESSAIGSATVPLIPTAPSNFSVKKAYPTEIDLGWSDLANEDGYSIEMSNSPTFASGVAEVARLGSNTLLYPKRNLNPNTTYYFRARAFNISGNSPYTPIVSSTTNTVTAPVDASAPWVVIFTNRGTSLPSTATNFLCDTANSNSLLPKVSAWMKTESNKYGTAKPFGSISCVNQAANQQISLPSSLWQSGVDNIDPINFAQVITYLQTNSSVSTTVKDAIKNARFVTIVHYLPYEDINWTGSWWDTKYSAVYLSPAEGVAMNNATTFWPELNIDNYGRNDLIYDVLSGLGLGATAKWTFDIPGQWCLTDPSTGQPYSGFDIMCYQYTNPDPSGSYIEPTLSDLVVSEPTAKETCLSGSNCHPADTSLDLKIDSGEQTGYTFCWKTVCVWPKAPTTVTSQYQTSAVFIWKLGVGSKYHYNSALTCPQCYVQD